MKALGNALKAARELAEQEISNTEKAPPQIDEYFTKRRRGRPTKPDGRHLVKPIRWTVDQWDEVETAAQTAGMTPSALIRAAVLSQVREINKKR